MVLGMLKPMMPKFEKWLITNDQGNPEIRIDVVSMKVVNDKLTVNRVLQTISQKELLSS